MGQNHISSLKLRDGKRTILICIVLALVVISLFWQVRNFDFIWLDDDKYVFENLHIREGFTKEAFLWAFTADIFWDDINTDYWQPLTIMSRMLDLELFGLSPGMHHLHNVLLHLLNVLLIFIIFRKMTGAVFRSAAVAAIFAIHPMQVEAVVWVTARKDVLSGLFACLMMLAYVYYARSGSKKTKGLVICMFTLGLMSKPSLVSMPAALLLLDYWPLKRAGLRPFETDKWKRVFWEKFPLYVLSVLSFLLTMIVISGAVSPSQWAKIANGLVSYVVYLRKMIYPAPLGLWYEYPGVDPGSPMPSLLKVSACGFIMILISFFIVRQAVKRPYLLVGWLWYVGTVAPAVGLRPRDRALYLSMIGLLILVIWALAEIIERYKINRWITGIFFSGVFLFYFHTSYVYAGKWAASIPIYEHTIKATGGSNLAFANLAVILSGAKRYEEAEALYRKVIDRNPEDPSTLNNFGNLLKDTGRLEEAMKVYDLVIQFSPEYSDVYNNKGNALLMMGREDEALENFVKSVQLQPTQFVAISNIGRFYEARGQYEEALKQYKKVVEINPYYTGIYFLMGPLMEKMEKYGEATAVYAKLIALAPDQHAPYTLMGTMLSRLEMHNESLAYFKAAVDLNPDSAQDHHTLANALLKSGQLVNALIHYKKSLELDPGNAVFYANLGNCYAALKDYKKAMQMYSISLELQPDQPNIVLNVANCYYKMEQYEDAIKMYRSIVDENPSAENVWYNIGMAYIEQGSHEMAKDSFLKALEIDSGYEAAKERLTELEKPKD